MSRTDEMQPAWERDAIPRRNDSSHGCFADIDFEENISHAECPARSRITPNSKCLPAGAVPVTRRWVTHDGL